MLTFSYASSRSLDHARQIFNRLYKMRLTCGRPLRVILVGTKADLKRRNKVTSETAIAFAKERGLVLIDTSSKCHLNISEAFELCAYQHLISAELFE